MINVPFTDGFTIDGQVEKRSKQVKADTSTWDLDRMTDELWHDLQGKASLQAIRQVLTDVSLKYQDARVQIYVPIFVRRRAMEILRLQMDEQ